MGDTRLDYSRYFWQGDKVRLRPTRVEDDVLFGMAAEEFEARWNRMKSG
jgi:hypothetical protein